MHQIDHIAPLALYSLLFCITNWFVFPAGLDSLLFSQCIVRYQVYHIFALLTTATDGFCPEAAAVSGFLPATTAVSPSDRLTATACLFSMVD